MIRGFDEEELEPAESQPDTELTLGPGMLLAIGGGLLLLCCLCFWLGYGMGHRGSSEASTASQTAPAPAQTQVQASSATSKPTAGGVYKAPAPVASEVPNDATVTQDSASSGQGAVAAHDNTAQTLSQAPATPQLQVRQALPTQASASQVGANISTGFQVQPALSQGSRLMVQIAAVSHREDAEVLVNALRKHGYAVTARRELSDSLIHVEIGPFADHNDANAMRQKLLSDGYNAIVQP
jgi:DedD protein